MMRDRNRRWRKGREDEVANDGLGGDRPAEFVAEIGDEVGKVFDALDRFRVGGALTSSTPAAPKGSPKLQDAEQFGSGN